MFKHLSAGLAVFLVLWGIPTPVDALGEPTRKRGILAPESQWATPYFLIDSGREGPTVLVVGGIHGNEPAGVHAAEAMAHWSIGRGKLLVLPRANQPALAAGQRCIPEAPSDRGDLNRNFPKADGPEEPAGPLAEALWTLTSEHRPDWLLDLHEGYDFTQINPDSVGSSIIRVPSQAADEVVDEMLAAVNRTIEDPEKKLVPKRPPVDGSLARAAAEHLSTESLILETTRKSQPVSLRARQHRIMVHRFLEQRGMSPGEVDTLIDPEAAQAWHRQDPIAVSLYDGPGASGAGVNGLQKQLDKLEQVIVRRAGPVEIRDGVLSQFDVAMFPGGSGSRQSQGVGTEGVRQVRTFVENGGGYVGHCAGAYLATSGYSWGLKIINAEAIDTNHWRRGKADVEIELTDRGRELFETRENRLEIRYVNGPILAPAELEHLPQFETLAHFRDEVTENGAPKGVMIDTPAIVASSYGDGRVLLFSPHPEFTEGLGGFVHRAVEWTAGRRD